MKGLGKMISGIILFFNFIFAVLFIVVAYSPYISPVRYPLLSCLGLLFPFFLLIIVCFFVFWLIFHYKFALLSLIVLLICLPQIRTYIPFNFRSNDLPSGRVKVLSYNVMAFDNMKMVDGENPILRYIAKSNADIICLQEYAVSADSSQLNQRYVDEVMKGYPYRDVSVVGNKNSNNRLALFSRFPILLVHRIPYKSNYNGSVYYELSVEGDTVSLINNHLESNKLTLKDKEDYEKVLASLKSGKMQMDKRSLVHKFADASIIRAEQARIIADIIAKSKNDMVVCGDFNDSPLSYAHQVISRHLKDAFTHSGCGLGISYNQHKFYFRIDNILVSRKLKTYNCFVDRSIKDSDHYPILCYVSKKQ
jgi:endonuclease/exonuclease/phosphatase family metal-dependent hydrolase